MNQKPLYKYSILLTQENVKSNTIFYEIGKIIY